MIPPQTVRMNSFPSDLTFSGSGTLRTPNRNSSVTVRAGMAGTIEVRIIMRDVGPTRIAFDNGSNVKTVTQSFAANQTLNVPFTWLLQQPSSAPRATSVFIDAEARYVGGEFGLSQQSLVDLHYPQTEAVMGTAIIAGTALGVAVGRSVRLMTAAKKPAKKRASSKKGAAALKKKSVSSKTKASPSRKKTGSSKKKPAAKRGLKSSKKTAKRK
jgi:hypothetical protein